MSLCHFTISGSVGKLFKLYVLYIYVKNTFFYFAFELVHFSSCEAQRRQWGVEQCREIL
jgi:hypothetical protein